MDSFELSGKWLPDYMNYLEGLRRLTKFEKQLVNRLLEADFEGCEVLRTQVEALKARKIATRNRYGSIELFSVVTSQRAVVKTYVPVEAEAPDSDGVSIRVLLYVYNGRLDELEILKLNGRPIKHMPEPEAFIVKVNN